MSDYNEVIQGINPLNVDSDGDGVIDCFDDFPDEEDFSEDTDGDGTPDVLDPDVDNDGFPDKIIIGDPFILDGDEIIIQLDLFPKDPNEWEDFDGDGIGDNADLDDDNDGIPDAIDPVKVIDQDFSPFGDVVDPDSDVIERLYSDQSNEYDKEVYVSPVLTPGSMNNLESKWTIRGLEFYPNSIVEVYNRNGQRVFKKRNYQNDWEGEFNNSKLPSGSYLYKIYLPETSKTMVGWLFITY